MSASNALTNVHEKNVILIVGPTAVGKTALSLQLAKHFNTAIISADSRQCYKELNIGVAKPTTEELHTVDHYFINSHSINDNVDAAVFENYALKTVETILLSNQVAIMVGGTGMYIKAFCEGLDQIPTVDENIRYEIRRDYEANGLKWLQDAIAKEDIGYYTTGEIYNPQRMMRALEVKRGTGKSIRDFQQQKNIKRPFNIIKIGLELPKPILHERIHQRIDAMMEQGLLEEVRSLLPYQRLNALQTVGYKELFDYLNGHCSLKEAVENIKTNTRRYAKRQMTWFKKNGAFKWFHPLSIEDIIRYFT